MKAFSVASSRKADGNGLEANEHALFYVDAAGESHVFYRSIEQGWQYPKHRYGGKGTPENNRNKHELQTAVPAVFAPGEFLPRVWRGLEHPTSTGVGLYNAEISTRRVVGELCGRLERVFWHVEPATSCRDAFSHELRSLLILACTEVESSWKAILKAHQYPLGRWSTNDYVKLLVPLRLADWHVVLEQHPSWGEIRPFAAWAKDNPTTSIRWYEAYNEVKHDREENLPRATLDNVINAVAAAYVLMTAQFGWSITAEDVLRIPLSRPPAVLNLVRAPAWTAEQEFMAPIDGFAEQLGHATWTPKFLSL